MAQISVLIVEYDRILADAYKAVLSHANIRFQIVHDGQEALRQARKIRPDLFLLDLRIAKLNGLEVLRRLKPRQTLPRTKVILFTNYSVQADIDEAFRLGASHYLLKSLVTPRQLMSIVQNGSPVLV